jgi:hypothetical protein
MVFQGPQRECSIDVWQEQDIMQVVDKDTYHGQPVFSWHVSYYTNDLLGDLFFTIAILLLGYVVLLQLRSKVCK